jgi:hypothetical protein
MSRLFPALLALILISTTSRALADTSPTVLTVAGPCLRSATIAGAGTVQGTMGLSSKTGASYTVQATDACSLITSNNSSPVAWSLPAATGAGFGVNFWFKVWNYGAGTVTITPATSTIGNGAATLAVPQSTGCTVVSDGANYQVGDCMALAPSGGGGTFNPAAPGPIGNTTPSSAAFTTIAGGAVTPSVSSSPFVFSQNASSAAPITGANAGVVQFIAADGTPTRIGAIGYGASNGGVIALYAAGGTGASPSAVTANKNISAINAGGFDGTTLVAGTGQLLFTTTENWSGTARGTKGDISITPTGGITSLTLAQFDANSSSISLGGATGAESLNVPNVGSAVDKVTITGSATGSPATVTVAGTGADSNINLNLVSKGSGAIELNGTPVGTAATANTGTSGATVPLLNAANTWGAAQALASSTATTQTAGDNSTKIATTAYVATAISGVSAPALRDYIAGLTLSNDSGAPNTIIDVSAGQATDSTNSKTMTLTAFTKTTGAFATGTGNGGLDTGTVAASTWYHVFLISNSGATTFDALLSKSATAPTMPSGFTLFRRVGSILTDGSSHILAFVQDGQTFYWGTQVLDLSNGANSTISARTLVTLTVPTGVKVRPLARLTMPLGSAGTGGLATIVTSPDEVDVAPSTSGSGSPPLTDMGLVSQSGNTAYMFGVSLQGTHYTNTSAQIGIRIAVTADGGVSVATRGWVDDRGIYN